jgi:UDP:flavonoid glycosyltransferase YjiC (YdhE family)
MRILLTTAGSLGDLHPYLAVAVGLKNRGHQVAVGTCEYYRPRVEKLGLEFRPIGPTSPRTIPRVIDLVIDQEGQREHLPPAR